MRLNDPQMTQISADLRRRNDAANHLRKSASSADSVVSPAPGEIEVHIEELVLHGFDPHARWEIGDAVERELHGLLSDRGLPASWEMSPDRLMAGKIRLTSPAAETGTQIARAVYGGDAI